MSKHLKLSKTQKQALETASYNREKSNRQLTLSQKRRFGDHYFRIRENNIRLKVTKFLINRGLLERYRKDSGVVRITKAGIGWLGAQS